MIVYADSSVVVRGYLPDESDHTDVWKLLDDPNLTVITGSWTVIEVTGSLVRAAKAYRGDKDALLASFSHDTDSAAGSITIVDAEQSEIERIALELVRLGDIRSMDAWHLACARLALDELAEPGEELGFATRDAQQAAVAREMGFTIL